MTKTTLIPNLLVSMVLFFVGAVALGQSSTATSHSVDVVQRARAVGEAVWKLQESELWLISYEDEPREYSGDVEDLTYAIAADQHAKVTPQTKHFIGPRRGSLTIKYSPTDGPQRTLEALANQYASRYGTVYSVLSQGDRFVVVPSRARDTSGVLKPIIPILSTPISLNLRERTFAEALDDICAALTQQTGQRVAVGVGPFLGDRKFQFSALNEPARNVLVRLLGDVGAQRLVWMLYEQGGQYGLSFRYIPAHPLTTSRAAAMQK